MSLKIFVSSTKNDLDQECRPRVIEAVEGAEAVPIIMEKWPAEYLPALDLVKAKIDASTHYLGLFAYRRGWTPPGSAVSITEAEFDHACARLRGHIAVFVPTEGSEIAKALMARATAAEDAADTEAQARFLKRVLDAAVVESFHDVPNLSMRATRRVVLWNSDLLKQELARQTRGVPDRDDIMTLGRDTQADCFRGGVVNRLAAGGAPAAGALISGPAGHGHDWMLQRLVRQFEAASPRVHACRIGCNPAWRTGGLAALLGVLGKETGVAALASVPAAASHLATLLNQKDVVLQVTGLQRFENGVPGFVERFWAPLADALPAGTPYRLLCVATHEGVTPPAPALNTAVQPCGTEPFDPRRLVALPPLEPFTEEEVTLFVRPRVEPASVAGIVASLMADSGEGSPAQLYTALANPDYWPTPGDTEDD